MKKENANRRLISKQKKRTYITGFLFALPCIAMLILMMLNPLIKTFVYSFSKIKFPQLTTTFDGLTNFKKVLSRNELPQVINNTVIWIVAALVLRFFLGFVAALALNNNKPRTKIMRVLVLLPWTIPSVVTANTWRWMMQTELGLLNQTLKGIGLSGWAQNWLGNPKTALASVLVAYAWSGFPFVMMMLLAGLQSIPDDLYEAGKIDGANDWHLFLSITLPGLKNVIIAVLLLEITSGLNSFDLLFTMTGGGPGGKTEILGLLIHRLGFTNFDFGGASALSVIVIIASSLIFVFNGSIKTLRKAGKVR